jgi:LysR family transcriptional regulator, hydrogen peroxide-inducible genes activator
VSAAVEISHVRYFLALCQERNFTRAARRCGVAQPSLTRAIKVLERELGGPLFRRLPGGAELTDLGIALGPHFAAIGRHAQAIQQFTRGSKVGRTPEKNGARAAARS